jgi:hypothetical protein
MCGAILPLPHYAFLARCLVKESAGNDVISVLNEVVNFSRIREDKFSELNNGMHFLSLLNTCHVTHEITRLETLRFLV